MKYARISGFHEDQCLQEHRSFLSPRKCLQCCKLIITYCAVSWDSHCLKYFQFIGWIHLCSCSQLLYRQLDKITFQFSPINAWIRLFSFVFVFLRWSQFSIHVCNTKFHFQIQFYSDWKKCSPAGKQASPDGFLFLFLGSTSSSPEDLLACLVFRVATALTLRNALGFVACSSGLLKAW